MLLVLLSMLGVNIGSALLLPAGLAVAVAGQQLAGNWLAGFFLFMAQVRRNGARQPLRERGSGWQAGRVVAVGGGGVGLGRMSTCKHFWG